MLKIISEIGDAQSIDNMDISLQSRVTKKHVAGLIAVACKGLPVGHLQYVQQDGSISSPYPGTYWRT